MWSWILYLTKIMKTNNNNKKTGIVYIKCYKRKCSDEISVNPRRQKSSVTGRRENSINLKKIL